MPLARCSGRYRKEQAERADNRESDVQRGGLRGQGNPHAGGTAEELPEGGLRQRGSASSAGTPPSIQVIPAGGPQDGSRWRQRDGHEKQVPGVDHAGAPESESRDKGMFHVQEISQEVGGADDGAPARAQDGANTPVLLHGGGSVRAATHHRIGEQAYHREGLGSHLR
ncbi:MAG: hypothetical protein ACK55Z_32070, partial [bacterium]